MNKYPALAFSLSLVACGGGGDDASSEASSEGNSAEFNITTSVAGTGSIEPVAAAIEEGGSLSFELRPGTDYSLNAVTGCNGELNGASYVVSDVQEDCTVEASFKLVPLNLTLVTEKIYNFYDDTIVPAHEYGGVEYPESLISYMGTADTSDLWLNGNNDVIFSLARGYASGIDTRVQPYVFRNENGRLVFADEVNFTPTNSARRWASFGNRVNDDDQGIFYVGHTAGEEYADAMLIEAGAEPEDITSTLPDLPLSQLSNNPRSVNAHAMSSGDINGNGRTDFVVGEWGDCDQSVDPWVCYDTPYYLIQNEETTSWRLVESNFLRELALEQPLENEDSNEGSNLLLDIHLVDADGDGYDDLITGYGHGSSYSYLYFHQGNDENGSPIYNKEQRSRLPESPYGVDNGLHLYTWSADVNGNGAQDLIILWSRFEPYYGGWDLQLLINDEQGGFTDATDTQMVNLSTEHRDGDHLEWSDQFSVIDLNNNGFPDIIGSDQEGMRLWLNDESGSFVEIPVSSDIERSIMPNSGWADFAGADRFGSVAMAQSCTDHKCEEMEVWFYQVELNRPIRSLSEERAEQD